jgi:hypothetical protein
MPNADHFGLSSTIRESDENCVFILNNISPKDVNHNLNELKNVAYHHNRQIYILLSTNLPYKSWKHTTPDYWYFISPEGLEYNGIMHKGLYNKMDLVSYLNREIKSRQLLNHRVKLLEVVKKLINKKINTPEQVDIF